MLLLADRGWQILILGSTLGLRGIVGLNTNGKRTYHGRLDLIANGRHRYNHRWSLEVWRQWQHLRGYDLLHLLISRTEQFLIPSYLLAANSTSTQRSQYISPAHWLLTHVAHFPCAGAWHPNQSFPSSTPANTRLNSASSASNTHMRVSNDRCAPCIALSYPLNSIFPQHHLHLCCIQGLTKMVPARHPDIEQQIINVFDHAVSVAL